MKSFKKNFRKRIDEIDHVMRTPQDKYTPETFHKLRVEIKKVDALFELLNNCAPGFRRKKAFIIFKKLFKKAGKIRELQVEEGMLVKYFSESLLERYRSGLTAKLEKEKKAFFSMNIKEVIKKVEGSLYKVERYIDKLDNKHIRVFMIKKGKKILKLLTQNSLKSRRIHSLRKQLKNFNYNVSSIDLKKHNKHIKNIKMLSRYNSLSELLGSWHDCRIIIRHLKKVMADTETNKNELSLLEKIEEKFVSESSFLFSRIIDVMNTNSAAISKGIVG